MIRYYNFAQRSPEWYVYRKGRWTGSTAIDLLKGAKAPPKGNPDYDNKYMQRGRILEPLAIEAYEKSIDKLGSVRHYGFITNSKYKHAGYSPDGIIDNTLIEVKCLNEDSHMDLDTNDIPMRYMAQIQFGLLISELPCATMIYYNPEAQKPLIVVPVKPIPAIQANMIKRLKETEPKRKPSQLRADERYRKNNSDKVRESNYKRYIKGKKQYNKNLNGESMATKPPDEL